MKKSVFLLFFLISNISLFALETDSLIRVLDKTIQGRPKYEKQKEGRIDSLKNLLNTYTDDEHSYRIHYKLFKEYCNYNMDSALSIANKSIQLSMKMNNEEYITTSKMSVAEVFGIMGMYKESLDILDGFRSKDLDFDQKAYYFHLYHSMYILMSENSFSQIEKQYYENLTYQYKDSLLAIHDPNSFIYHLIENGKFAKEGRYDEALSILKECYKESEHNQALLGMLAYGTSEIYGKKGDKENEKKYLIISSIADLRMGVKEYIALHKLAVVLYKEGDVSRAYKYMKCAMEDAIFCKARYRTMEMSEMLPIINSAYDKKMKQEKSNLFKYLILISILVCILIISLIYIYQQLKKLSAARKSINLMYEKTKSMNEDLNELNKKLSESNLVKEEYIGSVFNLCSTYIDKMEAYRININRKLKSGQIDEASKITNSSSLVSDELKEFFRNFDAIFLNIYPNFVEEFNALLLNGEQIIPKTGDILTPELRVFALVRLGITDSSKIASFLHYSPQTVYNYNLKVRNKLTVSKEEFSIAIQQIGK